MHNLIKQHHLGALGKILLGFSLIYFFDGFGYAPYVGFVVCVLVLLVTIWSIVKKDPLFKNNLGFFVLTLFSFIYALNIYQYGFSGPFTALSIAFFPPVFYLAGRYVFMLSDKIQHKYLILTATIAVMTIYALICVIYTLNNSGAIETASGQRLVIDLWTLVSLNATNIGGYIALGIGMVGVIFVKTTSRAEAWIKFSLLAISAACIFIEFHLVNRTDALVLIAGTVASALIATRSRRGSKKMLALASLSLVAIAIAFQVNLFKVNDVWQNTQLYHRFAENELVSDGRFSAWRDSFWGIFENPEGGKATIIAQNYAHNLWLDVGYSAGFIPFLILIIFSVIVMKNHSRLILNNKLPIMLRCMVAVLSIGYFLTFMAEPVMEGLFTAFISFCFISGAISMYANSKPMQQAIRPLVPSSGNELAKG